jgi:hypothetical protein
MTTTTTTTTATHFRLSIELSHHTCPDTRDGEPGEVVTLADLIATDDETGERYFYCGPADCSTHGKALDLMARIYAWERSADHRLDPRSRPACWAAENLPVAHEEEVAPAREVKRSRRRKVDAGKARRARVGVEG